MQRKVIEEREADAVANKDALLPVDKREVAVNLKGVRSVSDVIARLQEGLKQPR